MTTISEQQEKYPFTDYDPKIFGMKKLQDYVKECCSYTWKLVCQTPPYQIEGNFNLAHAHFDSGKHQVCSGSKPPSHDPRIYAVIWPALLGPSKVIRKAEVFLCEN